MRLTRFAYLPDYKSQIETLTTLAREERWDYIRDHQDVPHKILVNYVDHTFQRLQDLHKRDATAGYLYISDEYMCFDTGLFTKHFEPIYALFIPNDANFSSKWKLTGFYKKSAWELRKISNLPRRASYFDDFAELVYDTRIDLRINIDHILDDERNKARIPEKYRTAPNLAMLFTSAALEYAKVRIKENYKAAVPQYYSGKIQFLLPISLGDPTTVDLSLAVGKEDGVYTGRTCLTLDMAYNNARLIAKPESDWLIGS